VIKEIISNFVFAFEQDNYNQMNTILADDLVSYITDAKAGSKLLKGKNEFIENMRALKIEEVKLTVKITQILEIEDDQGLVMVEINAARKNKTLHNYAAFLINTKGDKISEIRMVEALPAYSDEFWKN